MHAALGRLVASVVTLPSRWLGLVCDLVEKLSSHRGGEWYEEMKLFLKREPCWVAAEEVEDKEGYLSPLYSFKLRAVGGAVSDERVRKVFPVRYASGDPVKWGVVFDGVAHETEIAIDKLVQKAKFSNFFGKNPEEIEKRRILGSQLLDICENHYDKLTGKKCANFFIVTVRDQPVKKDLSNVLVVSVTAYKGGGVGVHSLFNNFLSRKLRRGGDGQSVFSRKQTTNPA